VTYTPNTGTTASSDTYTYTVSDGHGATSTATVTIHLANTAPIANSDIAVTHSAPVTVAVLANDFDFDGDRLTVTAVGTPTNGAAVRNADNTVTYTPNSGTTAGSDSFTYTISDGHGGTSSATVTVQLANRAPTAVSDSASTHAAPVTIAVLANDGDPDGDPLTVTAVGTPASGTAVRNADNTVTYTPNSGTTASTDQFTYTVSDGHGGTSTATVSIQLANQAPKAVDDVASTHSAAVIVPVLANDSDPDGDRLTVTAVGAATSGTAVLNADGTVTYTPNSGTTATSDQFTYTVSDGHGGSSTATVTINIGNQAPVAVNDTALTAGSPIVIPVLANDSDPDGDRLTVTAVGTPLYGTATLNADGTVTYTPSGTMFSPDQFTYTISDGHGGTSTATVTVALGPGVVAGGTSIKTLYGLPAVVYVLGSDADPYGDSLAVTGVGGGTYGNAFINADGTITYIPTPGTGAQMDTFTYTITDQHGGTSTATVTVFFVDHPIAAPWNGTTFAGVPETINVLASDYDPDGEALTVTAVGPTTYGSVHINADGTITYTPNAGVTHATDVFTYTISDGHGGYSTATIEIVIM
jgi:serine/threonine protein phosphatase PrpC